MLASNWLKDMREDELIEVAQGIKSGKVFTNKHFKSMEESKELTPKVFLPIGSGVLDKATKEEIDNLGMLYEWYRRATVQKICGYPIFYSVRYLTTSDTSRVAEMLERFQETESSILGVIQ